MLAKLLAHLSKCVFHLKTCIYKCIQGPAIEFVYVSVGRTHTYLQDCVGWFVSHSSHGLECLKGFSGPLHFFAMLPSLLSERGEAAAAAALT